MRRQLVGTGLAAALVVAVAAGPAAAFAETVTATGAPSGVIAICPDNISPTDVHVTDGDGTPLGPGQRVRTTAVGSTGVGAWIAPYDGSPPPPAAIRLTITCTDGS
ncbi:hypothetical protein [Kitasatospora sp. CB01950]|uniref:hypothetical protein n=1 Tax=Kitasatospora sp. CB01950 TaxID=1703930 RepID=UPI00093B40DC|nr:hypothetical protein [Kitasatospora sp. CB01950]OKJ05601.1 hypothetical protein AMK19_25195 [Kitasatospora sp. CB01950]